MHKLLAAWQELCAAGDNSTSCYPLSRRAGVITRCYLILIIYAQLLHAAVETIDITIIPHLRTNRIATTPMHECLYLVFKEGR